ncbi:hypothetical protein EGW08_022279 [Elysia chlorotica]|uniref:SOCS box domain-containing protein n=1 Tax=Elysia chlorotica TaxID=188477 RepID=A0A3S1BLL4_ELYCH|nr:hypothetical protein EGW08_022279 [Elysia chlorotica]
MQSALSILLMVGLVAFFRQGAAIMAGEWSARMYFAVVNNDAAGLAQMIADGGDVDQFYDDVTNVSSRSLLHVCCGRGHVQCLSSPRYLSLTPSIHPSPPHPPVYSGVTPALVCASTGDLETLRPLLQHNCCLTTKGSVYKRRRRLEYSLDPFELAYSEGFLHLCRLMVDAGYCVYGLRDSFLGDFHRQTSNPGEQTTHTNAHQDPIVIPIPAPASSGQNMANAEMPTLTFGHAQKLPDDWLDILLWLISKASNVRSLKEEAVFAVRAIIGHRLPDCIDSLPLPKLVKDYVMLKNLRLDDASAQHHGLFGKPK